MRSLSWKGACFFNELVANEYAHTKDEFTPWHSDESRLLGDGALIVSITLGSPGVFCFAPKFGTLFATQWHYRCHEWRKQNYKDNGVRGCVALFPGI